MRNALFIFVMIALVAGCASSGVGYVQEPSVENIEPAEARTLIDSNRGNPDFVLLDVRKPDEFSAGHIEGAMNLDYFSPDFKENLDTMDRNKEYLVHCKAGKRCAKALKMMGQLGFKKMYNMIGGFVRWKSEGLPVTR